MAVERQSSDMIVHLSEHRDKGVRFINFHSRCLKENNKIAQLIYDHHMDHELVIGSSYNYLPDTTSGRAKTKYLALGDPDATRK